MKNHILRSMTALALFSASAPVLAANPTSFSVGPTEIAAYGLDGYCLPEGDMKAVEQLMSAADTMNVTLLTMLRCDSADGEPSLDEYFILKTPKQALMAMVTQEQLFAALSAEFGNPASEVNTMDETIFKEVSHTYTDMLKTDIQVDGTLNPAGFDDGCGYLAGVLELSSGAESVKAAVAVCITAVKNKMVSVNYYAPGFTKPDVIAAMKKAHDIALHLKTINAQ